MNHCNTLQNFKLRIQYGGCMSTIMLLGTKFPQVGLEVVTNSYSGVFEVADYDYVVRISESNMAYLCQTIQYSVTSDVPLPSFFGRW